MRGCLTLAGQAFDEDEVPIGAMVVLAGEKIIGKGYNQTEKLRDVTAHAEMLALTAASEYLGSKYLHDCIIYVSVEPCPMCAAALSWAQISTVVYGTADPKKGYSNYSPLLLHPKTVIRSGVLAEECGELVRKFFRGKRIS